MSIHKPAILLIGHGTRVADGIAEFHCLADRLRAALPERLFAIGFLELSAPSIRESLEALIQRGVTEIVAIPAMLLTASHIKNDIPNELNAVQTRYPHIKISYGTALETHPYMLQAAEEKIATAEEAFNIHYKRNNALLMVIGRGTSDSDANANVSKITRLLWEKMGFGWATTCYSGVTVPLVAESLERSHRLGYPWLIVFPYVLFAGRLLRQIHTIVDAYQAKYPKVQVSKAPYFRDHPLVVRTFLERLRQTEGGIGHMNCQLCQYKEPIVGYEHRYGMPQRIHLQHSNSV
jgi:sirohydrochlorin cobaltochelatase